MDTNPNDVMPSIIEPKIDSEIGKRLSQVGAIFLRPVNSF